jgi:hypothetical protein
MTLSHADQSEFSLLLDLVVADATSESERARLNHFLRTSDEARRLYVDYFGLHAALGFYSAVQPLGTQAANALSVAPTTLSVTALDTQPLPWRSRRSLSWLAAAGVLAAACWGVLAMWVFPRSGENRGNGVVAANEEPQAIGYLTAAIECHWIGSQQPAHGDALHAGLLHLSGGVAELLLVNGVQVSLEGPTSIDLQQVGHSYLQHGKLVARVPAKAVGFTIETPTAMVVDLGTEFGVDVNANSGETEVHVLRGTVETRKRIRDNSSADVLPVRLTAGSAIRISPDKTSDEHIAFDNKKFRSPRADSAAAVWDMQLAPADVIPLGNLFDDPRRSSLASAIETDTFCATPEIDDLGVERVLHGREGLKQIAPMIWFDASNLGWEDAPLGEIGNDVWGVIDGGSTGGIRTRGSRVDPAEPKIEDGIGVLLNVLITFDLDEIRAAGGPQQGREFEFVCDRAGINDDCAGDERASVQMAVLVSNSRGVQTANVNGAEARVADHKDVWSVVSPIGKPLRADGQFAQFRVKVPADARYLTLLASSAGDGGFADHAVWSGARLEVQK